MPVAGTLLLVVAGIALLAGGGEVLVRGAVSLARSLHVSAAVIGLTVVAVGTSMPELAVSLLAGLQDRADIAVANVVGSNIFNVACVVGIAALLLPLKVHMTAVRLEGPFMFASLFVCLLLMRDGRVDRLEGGFFLASYALFTLYMLRVARREVSPADAAELAAAVAEKAPPRSRRAVVDAAVIVTGLGLLAVGAELLVEGAVRLSQLVGLDQRTIGLTVVAAGTSLPELAASVAAARHGQPDIALANVIGSNIFNVLGILGVVVLIQPQAVHPLIVARDSWWMVGTALALLPLMMTEMRVSRVEGAALLGSYLVYLWFLR